MIIKLITKFDHRPFETGGRVKLLERDGTTHGQSQKKSKTNVSVGPWYNKNFKTHTNYLTLRDFINSNKLSQNSGENIIQGKIRVCTPW